LDEIVVRSRVFLSLDELGSQPLVVQTDGYLEGALVLMINRQPIISELEWDILDQLWAYIVDGLEQLDQTQESEWSTYFPDQPIELRISRKGRNCEVVLKYDQVERRGRCEFAALRSALLTEAERFFRTLAPLAAVDGGLYRRYAEKAAAMLNQV